MALDLGSPVRLPASTARRRWRLDTKIAFGPNAGFGVGERMVFTERLALLLETGVSLADAIETLQRQSDDERMAQMLGEINAAIKDGNPFSVALSRHPRMFPRTYVSLVSAAEAGGFLPQVLDQLRALDEKNRELRSNVAAALSYPAFLILFSSLVVGFVLVVIFPKFESLFMSIRDQLPTPTLVLMALSNGLRHYWWAIGPLVAACALLGALWARSPGGRAHVDRMKLLLPVIGPVYMQIYLHQALGVLGLSLAHGVPITAALKAAQEVVENSVFDEFLRRVQRHVNEGRGLAAGFVEAAFIPPMVKQMIATGDQTGHLSKVMLRVSEFYGRELNKRIAVLARSMEPILLLVMGVVVGLIVASLILPIFKLSRVVH